MAEIKVKAMCLFVHEGKTLVGKHHHESIGDFYRVLGGMVEFYETSEAAVRREITEELGSEIENLEFLEVQENLFMYAGAERHEVDFLYKGDLVNKELYTKDSIQILDHGDSAVWLPIDEAKNHPHFFPGAYKKYL
jgi:8-oxo-dGTP pyrophosphatase MutT (NUDIX family)